MSSGRMHLVGDIHLVTNRCFQKRLLMLPNEQVNFIIGYWFARALELYSKGLDVYAFVFLSNHFHALIRDNQGTLSTFLCYFESNVAKNINLLLKRKGSFWQGHYDDVIVDGEESFLEKYTYVTCNAVKSGLVNTADEWIGWNSVDKALQGGSFRFTDVNKNRYNRASRNRKNRPDPKDFEETYEFTLASPLGFEDKDIEAQAAHIRPLLREQEAFHRNMRDNKPPLGIDAIRKQHPTDRPKSSSRSLKKRFACQDKARLLERLVQYQLFIAAYREIYHQFRIATAKRKRFHNEWPVGSYPPTDKIPIAA